MFTNPFSPIFGGKPDVFFGRNDIIQRFDLAMIDHGSDDRALFFTGTRGSGKTALLEQLSMRAVAKGRIVIDLGPEDTLSQFLHCLADYDTFTSTISPQASVTVLGVGGGFSAGSLSKTKSISKTRLQELLLEFCAKSKNGVLVTVDEVQKIPLDDMSSLCNAFQMASRKGHDIMLAVAGLPYSYKTIIAHEGCTYLRRASHEELGLFTWDEADIAFHEAFALIKGLKIDDSAIDQLNHASFGHPYLIQLLGYHLINKINESNPRSKYLVREEDLDNSIPSSVLAYERRALKPLVDELSNQGQIYLRAVSDCLNEDRIAFSSDIAKHIGKPIQALSRTRAHLIENGILASPEHGKLLFCIPYLANYIKKDAVATDNIKIALERQV